MRSISMISVASPRNIDRAELAHEVSTISAENQVAETFRHCPRCHSGQFEQRPWRDPAG